MSKVVHQDFFNFLFLGGGLVHFKQSKVRKLKEIDTDMSNFG